MKYTHMLLCTLVVSLVFGSLLFILGCYIRFDQSGLVNNYIADIKNINLDACVIPDGSGRTFCPIKPEFSDISLGEWANYLGSFIIWTGVVVLVLSGCGLAGALQKSQPLLIAMIVCDGVAIFMQYYLLDVILDGKASFHDEARDELKEMIATSYFLDEDKVNDFTLWFNAVQLAGECCGSTAPTDYSSLNYTLSYINIDGTNRHTFKYPPTCCLKDEFGDSTSSDNFHDILNCATDSWAMRAADKGCYNVIHKYIYDTYGPLLLGFLMCMIIWEGIQAILLFMIILRPQKTRRSMSSGGSTGGGRYGDQHAASQEPSTIDEPKKFIPFTKISSLVDADVTRIKSTEIW